MDLSNKPTRGGASDPSRTLIEAQLIPEGEARFAHFSEVLNKLPDFTGHMQAANRSAQQYIDFCDKNTLPPLAGQKVHGASDLEVQSIAMSILYCDAEQRINMGILTRGTHDLDDQLDHHSKATNRQRLLQYFFDPAGHITNAEEIGSFQKGLEEFAEQPELFHYGCHRMHLGSLFNGEQGDVKRVARMQQLYREFSMQAVSSSLQSALSPIPDRTYALTHKTVMETFAPKGEHRDVIDLFSLLYAPALLMADLAQEKMLEELPPAACLPTECELIKAVHLASNLLNDRASEVSSARKIQLNYVASLFVKVLTPGLTTAYNEAQSLLKRAGHADY